MSKYRAKKIVIDSVKFDSKHEAEYYLYLKKKRENGEIRDFGQQYKIELQPKFEKNGKKYRAITYTPDFAVYHNNGEVEYIDVKGYSTQQGELRKKLFDYRYPDKKLIWVSKSLKYGDKDGWIEHKELEKKRRESKKK